MSCTSLRKADKITSADQLVLEDDPNFLPELDLLQMDLDDPTMLIDLDSMQSPATITPDNSQRQDAFLPDLAGGLMEPASASSLVGGPVGAGYAFSVRGDSGAGTRIGSGFFQQDEPQVLLEDDLGMQIDADGNFVLDEDLPARDLRQPRAPSGRVDRTDIPSDSASERVRAEHAGGQHVADFVSDLCLVHYSLVQAC
jgi:meiotic recombination protein REC8